MSAQPGWYNQPDGSQRYWDGQAWTPHTRAATPPAPPSPQQSANDATPAAKVPFYKNKVVIGVVAGSALLLGYGATAGGGNQGQAVTIVSSTVTATATATATATVAAPPAESPSSQPTEPAPSEPTADATKDEDVAEPETFKMPKVVHLNLQDAQDKLQSLGSWVMDQQDASGLDRFQIIDSNWKVCSQKPKAGKVVPIDTMVVLKAVKLDEKCP